MATCAQYIYGDHAVFIGDTSRIEVEAALVYLDVDGPCTLLIAITVDRAGLVLTAEVDQKMSTCVDKDAQEKAVQAVRQRKFNTVTSPAIHSARCYGNIANRSPTSTSEWMRRYLSYAHRPQ